MLSLPGQLRAQTESSAAISGTVQSEKGTLLPGATVTVLHLPTGVRRSTTVNAVGRFEVGALLTGGPYAVQVTQPGLRPQVINNVFLKAAQAVEFAVVLLPEVLVVGSRGLPRTDVERPMPLDVFAAKDLRSTGQGDLGQQLQFSSPTFNSAKTGVNGAANYADQATLRGLSPDQVLVLVDGKRRHQFSALNLNVTVGSGTVVSDLNALPALALDRVEVLRDGAAAQYGSDAIAGVINLGLNRSVGRATALVQYGQTKAGDGATYLAGANYGLPLGRRNPGYLNLTLQYQHQDGTNRSDPYTGRIYSSAADPAAENAARAASGRYPAFGQPFVAGVYGSNRTSSYQAVYNLGRPLGDAGWGLYSFGTVSRRDILAYGFFRPALPGGANYSPLQPHGYVPESPGRNLDYSAVVGLSRKLAEGWNLDFSTGYGFNALDLNVRRSANASLGAASPTEFYAGQSAFGQSTTEVNASRNFGGLLGTKALNVAVGSQLRLDHYRLRQGDAASYATGPLAAGGKLPGANGKPGIAPEDEVNVQRTNVGVYADVESDLTERLLLTAAARYENYSGFGGSLSGKLGGRIKLTDGLSLRGSLNRGFRAPSLQQTATRVTTSTAQAGTISQTKQLDNDDPRLEALGVAKPRPETSWNYSLGLAAKFRDDLLFTLDAYQIDISNRIVNSERLIKRDIVALQTPAFADLSEIRCFTNALDTRTRGLDLVTTYRHRFGERQHLSSSLAFSYAATTIRPRAGSSTPDALQAGTAKPILLTDTVSMGLIERAQPRQKLLLSLTYQYGKFSLTPRLAYFGAVTAYEKPANKTVSGAVVYVPHISQEFGGKALLDLALAFAPSPRLALTVGANNLANVYPDRVDAARFGGYTNGEIPYTRTAAQFGFNGAYYYGNVVVTL